MLRVAMLLNLAQVLILFVTTTFSKSSKSNSIYSEGDIILGGLFPVHAKGTDENSCGNINLERGIQRLEAMRFAVDDINKNASLLKGVKLGVQISDTCSDATHALDKSLDFVMSTLNLVDQCERKNISMAENRRPIMAVIGGAYSAVSIQVANLLRLFKIPQISYASTSEELSDKERFGYFMRTVPPDKLQAKALADIVQYFNWTYVSTVASEGEYGESGITAFQKNFEKEGRCLAAQLKISRTPKEGEFNDTIKSLYKLKKARVVVLFVGQDHAAGILRAARDLGRINDFIWLASDGWGDAMKVVNDNEEAANGALTITLQSKDLKPFNDYFLNLTPSNNNYTWFKEYWEEVHGCKFVGSNSTHYQGKLTPCTGNEKQPKFQQESKIQFVYDAVYAVAVALDRLYREYCGHNATTLCAKMYSSNSTRSKLLQYIRENRNPDPYGNAIRFDENGDSLGYYHVMNYRRNETTGRYEYVVVGTWEDNELKLRDSDIVWPGVKLPGAPMSMCSTECGVGMRKDINDENACCWSCIECKDHQYLADETTCKDCGTGWWPTANKTACYELELQHIRWNSPFAIIPAILSCIGLIVTMSVVLIFLKHRETPVVKAAGRELSFMLLIGCMVCYGSMFVILMKPSTVVCLLQRFLIGAGFAIIYSALLMKTNRIYRIFKQATKTSLSPPCVSPKSQIIIALMLASAQVIVYAIWLIMEPPGIRTDTPNASDRSQVVLKCSSKESSLLISLAYNMLLIIVCTVYAVLTRKIPSDFNESKFIGFTMYTTCIVWLSFVPIYFGLKSSFQIQVTTLCTAVFLSATVALFCLFGPKIHVIVFHPHKNARKTTVERQRFSTNKYNSNKTETEYLAESPDRSRTSSFTRSPLRNASSITPRKSQGYQLKGSTIPEELTHSLLVEKESSSDSALTSTECEQEQLQSQPKPKPCIKYRDHNGKTTPNPQQKQSHHAADCVTDSSAASKNTDSTNTTIPSAENKSSGDPVDLDNLKETALLNLNQCLLESLDAITSDWDYVDDSSVSTCTPVVTPTTCPNGDSGLGMPHIGVNKINGLSTSKEGSSSKPTLAELDGDDGELPERLI